MTYPQKHKQAIDFFDKMQEKMQAEDIKRRKLSKQTTASSQPESMFLQFNPNHGELSFRSQPEYMSQQTTIKKTTWKPPTKVTPNESGVMKIGRKNDKQTCTSLSPTCVIDSMKINKNKNENESSHQHNSHTSSFKNMIQESTIKLTREKPQIDSTQSIEHVENLSLCDVDVKMEEDKFKCELSHNTCTMNNDSDNSTQNQLIVENSTNMQLQPPYDNDEQIVDEDEIATQQNPNLSKELDTSSSETNTQYSSASSGKKYVEAGTKEISDNEDIQLINSIDRILSENQLSQSQHSQSQRSEHYHEKITTQNEGTVVIVEPQSLKYEMTGNSLKNECGIIDCKRSVEITKIHMDSDSNNEITTYSTPGSTRSPEEKQHLRLEDSKKNGTVVINDLGEDNKMRKGNEKDHNEVRISVREISKSFEASSPDVKSKTIPLPSHGLQTCPSELSSCVSNTKKKDNAPSNLNNYNSPTNASEIIQKAINQSKIYSFCRAVPYNNVERYARDKSFELVDDQCLVQTDKERAQENKTGWDKNYEEHEPVSTKKDFVVKVEIGEYETVNLDDDEVVSNEPKSEKNKTENDEVEESNEAHCKQTLDNAIINLDSEENNENKTKSKIQAESEAYDEEKNGFDEDYSCLMISNSQLLELERTYYEKPENKKPSVVTAPPSETPSVTTSSIGVQTDGKFIEVSSNISNMGFSSPTAPTPPTAQWIKKCQETQKQLRDTIQEVGRLNAILLKIRKELWPQRNNDSIQ